MNEWMYAGNPMNVKRTVRGYAQAGMAGIMLEDQVAPKRCGHTRGKAVVSRSEALFIRAYQRIVITYSLISMIPLLLGR